MSCAEHDWLFSTPCPVCSPPVIQAIYKYGYPLDPVESAEQRKAEYAVDEAKENK